MSAQAMSQARSVVTVVARHAGRTGATIAAIVILLLPAIWNRFPLLQYDTGGYFARWFEGTLVPSRSTTYGLFLDAFWPLDFWPAVVLQAAVAVWIIAVAARVHRLRRYPFGLLAIIAVLSAATALPWLASVLLTDIFAGLAVLAAALLAWQRAHISCGERIALLLFIAFAASTHSATFAVLLALALAGIVIASFWPRLLTRIAVGELIAALTLGAAMLLATNYLVAKQIAWTPGGTGIAFGRLLQDGIVDRYLADHCPDPQLRLCPYRDQLGRDADDFLWGGGVFDELGRFEGLDDEMRRIAIGSLRDYPLWQIESAVVATARQLVAVGTGEGIIDTIGHTYGVIERFTPSVAPAMHAARQQRGELSFAVIDAVHMPIAWIAMALLPVIALIGLWRASLADLSWLAATTMLALLANAAVCGIISNPHDRYGSRIVWIAALTVVLTLWRTFSASKMLR
jgi:hypothetical protein